MSFTDAEYAIIGQAVSGGRGLRNICGASAEEVECFFDMANSALQAGKIKEAHALYTLLCAHSEHDPRFWQKLYHCRQALRHTQNKAAQHALHGTEYEPRISCKPC